MRSLKKNQSKLWYSLYEKLIPIYETDLDGSIIYMEVNGVRVPVETGEKREGYKLPVLFHANISSAKGSSSNEVFGISLDYTKSITTSDMNLPIDETSLIWCETTPKIGIDGVVDVNSSDYKVVQIARSLNNIVYAIKALPKG